MSEEKQDISKVSAINIKTIFLADSSVEVNRKVFFENSNIEPKLVVNINVTTDKIDLEQFIVSLKINCELKDKSEEQTNLIIEVEYCAIVSIKNTSDAESLPLIYIKIPEILFPYARETIDSLSLKAGFRSLNLAPFNFNKYFKDKMRPLHKNHLVKKR